MADLPIMTRKKIEQILQMSTGYVYDYASGKDFSDRTFRDFFAEFNIDIDNDKYAVNGRSKAKRLREFWRIGANPEVKLVMDEMLRYANPSDNIGSIDIETVKQEIALLKDKKYMNKEISDLERKVDYSLLSKEAQKKLQKAIREYSMGRLEDRENAVRDLADVLENLKDEGYKLNGRDDSDLFNIINNFNIRHSNSRQKNDYDRDVWLDWMYVFFLSTIGALVRLHRKGSYE